MSEFVTEHNCRTRTDKIMTAITSLEDRLYKDNGHVSIQTRLARQEQSLAMVCKIVYGSVTLTLLTVGGAILAMVIKG